MSRNVLSCLKGPLGALFTNPAVILVLVLAAVVNSAAFALTLLAPGLGTAALMMFIVFASTMVFTPMVTHCALDFVDGNYKTGFRDLFGESFDAITKYFITFLKVFLVSIGFGLLMFLVTFITGMLGSRQFTVFVYVIMYLGWIWWTTVTMAAAAGGAQSPMKAGPMETPIWRSAGAMVLSFIVYALIGVGGAVFSMVSVLSLLLPQGAASSLDSLPAATPLLGFLGVFLYTSSMHLYTAGIASVIED